MTALPSMPNELKECILENIAIYKIRLAFAKALLGHLIRNIKRCCECNRYQKTLSVIDACADGVFGTSSCCSIYLCEQCIDRLPLQCGHTIKKTDYQPENFDSNVGYYEHPQLCNVCNTLEKVARQWYGLSPTDWEDQNG